MKGDNNMELRLSGGGAKCVVAKVNADDHEFANGDLVVAMDGTYHVVVNGVLRDQDGRKSRYHASMRKVYVVPPVVRDDITTYEHARLVEVMNAVKTYDKKLKTTKPGHVYLDRAGSIVLYLGKGSLMNTTTMDTLTGHVHVELPYLIKARDGHIQKIRLTSVTADNVQGRANVVIGRYSMTDDQLRLNALHGNPELAGGFGKTYTNITVTKGPATRVHDLGSMPGFTPGKQLSLVTGDDDACPYADDRGVLLTTCAGSATPFVFIPA